MDDVICVHSLCVDAMWVGLWKYARPLTLTLTLALTLTLTLTLTLSLSLSLSLTLILILSLSLTLSIRFDSQWPLSQKLVHI